MNALDSPLEVLAFNPVNFAPLFNNLWPFLAVIAATMISFRHLRKMAVPSVEATTPVKVLHETVLPQEMYDNVNDEDEEVVVLSRGNSEKFFTVFYEGVENEEGFVGDDVDGEDFIEDGEGENETMTWTESTVVEMRGRELLGWYDFQDRSVLNGSVVRLWDGERDRSCSPRGRHGKRNGYSPRSTLSQIFV